MIVSGDMFGEDMGRAERRGEGFVVEVSNVALFAVLTCIFI